MKADLPETDIIVVTYKARQQLSRCLQSLIRHTRDCPYQLTVVDNASSDGTAEYVKKRFGGRCRLVRSARNLGFSGGANLALRRTGRSWVVLLDDDAEVTPGWIGKFFGVALKDPKAGIIGGKVVFPNGRITCAEFGILPFGRVGVNEKDEGQRDYVRQADALPGPCWLMRRAMIRKVGGFDERFFPSQYEDIDYCIRARLAGYRIYYHGGVRVIHRNLRRSGNFERQEGNERKFFKKWGSRLAGLPLCSRNTGDRLAARATRLIHAENSSRFEHPVLGRVTRMNHRYPDVFYRGVIDLREGRKVAAGQRFRQVLEVVSGRQTLWVTRARITLLHLLSSYFGRLGMSEEAARCGKILVALTAREVNARCFE